MDADGLIAPLVEVTDPIETARARVEQAPADPTRHFHVAHLSLRAGHLQEAEAAARRAIELDENNAGFHAILAEILQRQRRVDEALGCVERAMELDPEGSGRLTQFGHLLMDVGRVEEAEATLRLAIERAGDGPFLRHMLGLAIERQGRAEEALVEARRAAELSPEDRTFAARVDSIVAKLNVKPVAAPIPRGRLGRLFKRPQPGRSAVQLEAPANSRDALFAAAEQLTGLPARQLAIQFESLGENCEFGVMQRACGAEPLGLARFSAILVGQMATALDAGFEGLADSNNLMAHATHMWAVQDRIYHLLYHTFYKREDISAEDLIRGQSKRLKFLCDKLMSDIAAAEKTFVVWGRNEPLTEESVSPLFEALRRRGPVHLLYVVPGKPVGMVETIRPGLMRGQIDRLAHQATIDDFSLRGWLSVLVNATLLRREG